MYSNEDKHAKISRALLIFNTVLVVCIMLMAIVIYSAVGSNKNQGKSHVTPTVVTPFSKIILQAKSVYVLDVVQSKVLFQKNEFVQLPLASVTKLMTALVATEIMPPESNITIRKEYLQEEGDSGLLAGETWKLEKLIDFSLLVSSNDGVRAIASSAGSFHINTRDYMLGRKNFVRQMNNRARELGLKQTYFINESGLDEGSSSGGYGSAIDVARLFQYILQNHPYMLEVTKEESVDIRSLNASHLAKNTNIDIHSIPGLIASKTGFTDLAGGNLAIAFDASIGKPIIIVVLGSTQDGRFEDVSALAKASREYLQQEVLEDTSTR